MLESNDVWTVFILILRVSMTITACLGFGLYLWYLKTSGDQSQSRLLNILNGYLSLTCIGFSLILLANYIAQPEEDEPYLIFYRIAAVFVIAVSTIFVFISLATILNHFMPGLYLDISVSWRHEIAIPLLIFLFILAEQTLYFSCPEKFLQCEVFRLRTFVMIPATLSSFICQLLVIIDDIWGWRSICSHLRLRGLRRRNRVTPANDGDMEWSGNSQQHLVGILF